MGKEVSRGSADSKSLPCWLATRSRGRGCGGSRGQSFASSSSVRSRSWPAGILPVAFSVALIRFTSTVRRRSGADAHLFSVRWSSVSAIGLGTRVRCRATHYVMAFNQAGMILVCVSSFHRFVAFILGVPWHGWHIIRSGGIYQG